MLGLTLRPEFQGRRLKGTAIELANERKTGATQLPAADFLEITYPTGDLLKALEATGPGQGNTVVLLGERGQGKSHLLAALYHALTDTAATQAWLTAWAERLSNPKIAKIPLRTGMQVIGESLHRHHYKFLWDLLFDRHPHGQFIRGKWEGMGEKKTEVPPHPLIFELFRRQPTALLLDEFQTWFDGLTNTKQYPWRTWAYNFIQILSEIAKEYPDLLVLLVSVRDGATDAYQQIHRVNPTLVDFKGPEARGDRRRLLLHRLFQNRLQVPPEEIERHIAGHVSECLRLEEVPPADHDNVRRDFIEAWPFSPRLLSLLEDQVLVATQAQETRDLIRILVDVFKSRRKDAAVLTAADFLLDEESSGVAALLDSVSSQHHASLREKALRNLVAVREAVKWPEDKVPHLSGIVGALWLRSLAQGNQGGAIASGLHLDITGSGPIDDNAFQAELSIIVENSFNIHQVSDRLVFREEENPQARLMATARNDRGFQDNKDQIQLAREVRYVLAGGDDVPRAFRVVVLSKDWQTNPWSLVEEADHPDRWDSRLPLLVVPEDPDKLEGTLGRWLKDHLQHHRNALRFILPRTGSSNLFNDRDLLVLARVVLKANEWKTQSPEFGKFQAKYQSELRGLIKQRFDRFAVLHIWDFIQPLSCQFHIEPLAVQGNQIPGAIEQCLKDNIFVPEEFEDLVLAAATRNESVGKLLSDLQEPRPNQKPCVPWLGETEMKERVIRLCAKGRIAIDVRGTELLQASPGEDEESAWRRMRSRLGTGKHLDETTLLPPQPTPSAEGVPTGSSSQSPPGFQPPGRDGGKAGQPGPGPSIPTPDPSFFGGGPSPQVTAFAAGATSPLNLIGKVESWGIGPGTSIRQVMIKLEGSTGAQLQKLLRALPDGLTYELSLEKEEK